jgi:hypothetical protein
MGKVENISMILGRIKERGLFQTITRFTYLPYDMGIAMQVVDAIGKDRNPKFKIDDENRFVYENMVRWIHGDPEMKCLDPEAKKVIPGRLDAGIYIAGNTGSGKSWALEIMAAYCLIDNVQVKTGEAQRCLYWGNVRTDVICDEFTESGSFDRFKKMSIIGIQDLGTDSEPIESMYMGNRISVLKQILEHRGDRTDQITLITSNLPMNHQRLIDRYGDRVSSRLNEMCNYFEIKGKDRRKI